MAGLGPAVHVVGADIMAAQDVGARDEPGQGAFEPKLAAKPSDELPFDFYRTVGGKDISTKPGPHGNRL